MRYKNPKGVGIRFERRVRKALLSSGFFCIRQAASFFPDIIAAKDGVFYAIECKVNGKLSREEVEKLVVLHERFKFIPVKAYKAENNSLVFQVVGKIDLLEQICFKTLEKLGV